MRLNLGSGSESRAPGFVNVDRVALPEVDVVHDLDVLPWPFDDACVKEIKAIDVFEHVSDALGFMNESHRILETGGTLLLKCPWFRSPDAFTDPTHRRFCTEHTWDYWIPGTVLFERHNPAYGGVSFNLIERQLFNGSIFMYLGKI